MKLLILIFIIIIICYIFYHISNCEKYNKEKLFDIVIPLGPNDIKYIKK